MAKIEKIPVIQNPVLIDQVLGAIQTALVDQLTWLSHAFGKAQRLVKVVGSKKYFSPNVYAGGQEYIDLSPDSNIGNYSFFVVHDPQEYKKELTTSDIVVYVSLIVWFDLRKIPGAEKRNTEFVKAEILKVLNRGLWLRKGRFTVQKIYEQAENIFQSFSIEEVDNQYLMQPYGGFRFYGLLTITEPC